MKKILIKHPNNPLVTPDMMPDNIMWVFNPGAIKHNGEYILMMDAATATANYCFWLARSTDGINFKPDPAPVVWPAPDGDHAETCVYDPRITFIDGEYLITYASQSELHGVRVGIVRTKDFITFERVATASEQANRNGIIFPEKINGLYCRLERPFGNPHTDPANIWLSYSPDLVYWGRSRPVMQIRGGGYWDNHKIGGGAVPIRTDKGWLEIYHGVTKTCSGFIYFLGVCLLDLEDPSKVIARGEDAVLWPSEPYEFNGRVPNVVFACNALLEPDGMVKIYYGAADYCIGLAEGKLEDLIDTCFRKNKLRL
jgi:beta-1,4-mannooligosaccharide/beta-1,4-mannosyl-N-acetylglucosamine phosphorylase